MVDDGHLDGEYTGGRRSTSRRSVSSTCYTEPTPIIRFELTSWRLRLWATRQVPDHDPSIHADLASTSLHGRIQSCS